RGRLPEARVNRDAAAVGDPLCEDETPDGTFTNKIAICKRGEIARLAKSFNVAQRGALLAPTSHLPVASTRPPPLRNEHPGAARRPHRPARGPHGAAPLSRQGLRLGRRGGGGTAAAVPAAHSTAGRRAARLSAWDAGAALGRRAHAFVVQPLPEIAHPLGEEAADYLALVQFAAVLIV